MKKIKLILLTISLTVTLLSSCSDNNPVESNNSTTSVSTALRTYFHAVKGSVNPQGRSANDEECFDFVFPITLSYNDGSPVVVNSGLGLKNLLENETDDLYLNGIAFPFQLVYLADNTTVTINTEEEFMDALVACGYETNDDIITGGLCFELVYPFSVINQDNETIQINSEQDLLTLVSNFSSDEYIVDFVYPMTIRYNGENVVVNNSYEFYEYANCTPESCICTQEYSPVCVQIPGGEIIEFDNACYAQCAGFSSSDFVNCN